MTQEKHPEEMGPVELAQALLKAERDIAGSPLEEAAPVAALMGAAAAMIADLYALGLVAEEAGELVQIVGKALRFGMDAPGPDVAPYHGRTARQLLPVEGGDMAAALAWARADGLIDKAAMDERTGEKLAKLLSPDSRDSKGERLAPEPRVARGWRGAARTLNETLGDKG